MPTTVTMLSTIERTGILLRSLALVILTAAAPTVAAGQQPAATATAPATAPVAEAAWPARLAALTAETAADAGKQLAALPPEAAMQTFLTNWDRIPEAAQEPFLASFRSHGNFGRLDALHLQILDSSIQMQNQALWSLRPLAFRDFTEDFEAYLAWYAANRSRPLDAVLHTEAAAFFDGLARAHGSELEHMAGFLQAYGLQSPDDRTGAILAEARKAGIDDTAAGWLTDSSTPQNAVWLAPRLLEALKPDGAWVRRRILPLAYTNAMSEQPRLYAIAQTLGSSGSWAEDPLLDLLLQAASKQEPQKYQPLAQALSQIGDPRSIPTMIAVIAADTSHNASYSVGYFGLNRMTGVEYSQDHDGAWWKTWWQKSRGRYPLAVRKLQIPTLSVKAPAPPAAVPNGAGLKPLTEDNSREGLEKQLIALCRRGDTNGAGQVARRLADLGATEAIPSMIGGMAADRTGNAVFSIGANGLGQLTGVTFDPKHDGKWWTAWWSKNRSRYPRSVRAESIPYIQPTTAAAAKDPRVAWLKGSALPVRSIDPNDADFGDLAPLAEMLKGVEIVQLGEESHGDGAAFLAKCRLVRYLHEKLGFDVLAWESGLFDCQQMEQALHGSALLQQAIDRGIFPIWGAMAQVRPVFEYARSTYATSHPLVMAGFDCQFSSRGGGAAFGPALNAFLDRARQIVCPEADRKAIGQLAAELQAEYHPTPHQRAVYGNALDRLHASIAAHLAGPAALPEPLHREAAFWLRCIDNLRAFEAMQAGRHSTEGAERPEDNNPRDAAMADNLLWLARAAYPGKKIVVWAASFHAMRNPGSISPVDPKLDYTRTVTMGHLLAQALGPRVFTIGFTTYGGEAGSAFFGAHPLKTPDPQSIEAQCHAVGLPNLLIPLRGLPESCWLHDPQLAWPLGYAPMRADWSRVFDALFFTDRMTPSTF